MVNEYFLVTALSPNDLVSSVNEKIKEGWQPVGGVAVSLTSPQNVQGGSVQHSVLMQAVVK